MAKNQRISFTVSEQEHAQVTAAADKQGKNMSTFTREAVLQSLKQTDGNDHALASIHDKLDNLQQRLSYLLEMRRDLAASVELLLVNSGKLTPAQAKDWVESELTDGLFSRDD